MQSFYKPGRGKKPLSSLRFSSALAAESSESQKTDVRANNYLSQVAAVIVGGLEDE